jgi:hypothetical protein
VQAPFRPMVVFALDRAASRLGGRAVHGRLPLGPVDLRLAEDGYPDKVSPLNTVSSFRFEHTANQNLAFVNCFGKFRWKYVLCKT